MPKRALFLVSAALLLAGCDDQTKIVDGQQQTQSPTSFAIAVLPDTQEYSRYNPSIYNAQTQWIAQNAASYNIAMALHLGDVVDRWNQTKEWQAADSAMNILEKAGVPYSVLAGNHDVIDEDQIDNQRKLADEPYLKYFGPERTKKQKGFLAADSTGYNTAYTFEAQGNTYMVLALDWRVSDETLKWANDLIKAHPSYPVILTSHQIMNIGPDMLTAIDTDHGKRLWEGLIKNNDQIFVTINGHHHGAANVVKKNAFGHDVKMMVVDYQSDYEGGNAYMRLLEFDTINNKMNVASFSPWVPNKPVNTLTQFDHAELKDANNTFSWAINYKERFAGFNKDFKVPSSAASTSIVERLHQSLAGFKEVPEPGTPAKSASDYPEVSGTVAHWRFVGTAGQPADDIADLSGKGNTLHRKNLNGGSNSAIVFSGSHSPLSAAAGSACQVVPSGKEGQPVSFWQTDDKAPLNNETFANGYTVETFVKIDKSFDGKLNSWMGILSRYGNGNDIPNKNYNDDRDEPLAVLDVSNLQELHWAVATLQAPVPENNELRTNWSWSIPKEKWAHVAIVNDGKTTRLFVEGAPVLRDGDVNIIKNGLFSAGKPWIVGAKHYAGEISGGFNGCIGEIRLVDHALKASEFLNARK